MSTIVPAPTSGVGLPTQIALEGSGVSHLTGNTYKVTLSLDSLNGLSNSVSVTAALEDIAGSAQSTGPLSFQAISRNTLQTGTNVPPDVQESTPTPGPLPPTHQNDGTPISPPINQGLPEPTVGEIATVSAVTNNGDGTASQTVTAQNVGQAVIDFAYGKPGKLITASLLVNVTY